MIRPTAFIACLALSASPGSLHAGSASSGPKAVAPSINDAAWGSGLIGGGLKSNDQFTEGSLFLTQPLWNSIGRGQTMEGSLFFVEPYGTWAEDGEMGASLGLGFRHLFSSQTVEDARTNTRPGLFTEGAFVGGNLFVDFDNTRHGSDFWQLGVGLEAGTRYFEVRGNYYIPVSEYETLSRTTETSSRTFVSRRYSETRAGAPFVDGAGNTVQSITRKNFVERRTVTTRRVTELYEEPMEGWDLELAMLVPGIDRWCDVRLAGGYYSYWGDRSHGLTDFSGWRAGVEVRPLRGVVLSATWYEKNQLYRDHWLVGVRFEIPLGGRSKDALTSGYRHLGDRLYEPVRRKNSAVTSSGVQEESTSSSTSTSTSTTTSGQTTTQNTLSTPPPPPPPPPPPQQEG